MHQTVQLNHLATIILLFILTLNGEIVRDVPLKTYIHEDFEKGIPSDWTVLDADGVGSSWAELANTPNGVSAHSGTNMVYHKYSTYNYGEQNGLLILPAISTDNYGATLQFCELNKFPTFYSYHGILVSTTDTDLSSFTELEQINVGTSNWTYQTIFLPYYNRTIYVAFQYKGIDADNWYIDDVLILPHAAIDDTDKQPLLTKLLPNYPNPFNPTTIISFSLATTDNVKLKIYDANGREIESLINAQMNSGKHDYKFSATDLSSGVYFYSLQVGNHKEVKKMIYTK